MIVFGLAIAVAFVGVFSMGIVNAYARDNSNDEVTLNYYQQGMMGYNYNQSNFERVYLHLSIENQEKLDLAFASELKVSDIQQKTVAEVVEMLKQIKVDILDEIQLDYSTQRYGMMGGNMMGYYNSDQYASYGINTYEWLYVHAYEEQRQYLDEAFAEAIMQLDFTTLSDLELAEIITEIKSSLVDQIQNPIQPNE